MTALGMIKMTCVSSRTDRDETMSVLSAVPLNDVSLCGRAVYVYNNIYIYVYIYNIYGDGAFSIKFA